MNANQMAYYDGQAARRIEALLAMPHTKLANLVEKMFVEIAELNALCDRQNALLLKCKAKIDKDQTLIESIHAQLVCIVG